MVNLETVRRDREVVRVLHEVDTRPGGLGWSVVGTNRPRIR